MEFMKKLIIILSLVILSVVAGVVFFTQRSGAKTETDFKFDVVSRGNIENIVSSTGTLSAVGTVNVGSQMAGTVENVYVDYNDTVKKGQVLATIDTTLLEIAVQDAQAVLVKSQAQLSKAETEYERNQTLFKEGYISEMTFLSVKTEVETTKASVISSESAIKKANINLKYAEIRSPIDGTVIERDVEAGQTIASNSSATLFTLTEDLAHMEIQVLVDESDISQIQEGMAVRFTVQSFSEKEFAGTVRQIRLQPKTVSDVVNYTVIVDASNEEGVLLPGMTATVDFLVEQRENVLLVSNSALYFKPSEDVLAQLQQQFQGQTADSTGIVTGNQGVDDGNPDQLPSNAAKQTGAAEPAVADATTSTQMAQIFYLDDTGQLDLARFVAGATDGAKTEVVQSAQLKEGSRIITGTNTAQKSSTKTSTSSLSVPGLNGGPPQGGMF
jgi:HlyD family secretion protein